ncbi:hypothetical protein L208DRAFT_1291619 [Tricholoma matsutake]|nr:hypothetical protein L208DRAFT_1291619 [Tricholoma matsutake 945]
MSDPPEPSLSNPDGQKLARQLLRPFLNHDIHDYILEGICKAVDGVHVLLILRTGGGKTGLFYGYILLLKELSKLESRKKRGIPKNPVLIVIYPTKGLEEEMQEKTFQKLGISALAINEDTLAHAHTHNENLWDKAEMRVSMLLLSPEQLSSRSFDLLLQKPSFST